jgi:uncharacterized protein
LKNSNEYSICFVGLKDGKHDFSFQIDHQLFERFGNTEIEHADIEIDVVLTKKPNHLKFDFEISGTITTQCDRCLDSLQIEIDDCQELYVSFGETTSDLTDIDDTMILARSEDKIDLAKHIYDYIILNIPLKAIHPEDDSGKSLCNTEMLNTIEKHITSQQGKNNTDPRWDKLKDLIN